MTDARTPEQNALEYQNVLVAFYRAFDGTGYVPNIVGDIQEDGSIPSYTITSGKHTALMTRDELRTGIDAIVSQIVGRWNDE